MSLDGPSPSCPLRASTNSAASILSDSDMGVVNATNIGQAATANGSSIVVNGTTLQTGIHVLAAKVGGSPVELLVRVIQPPTIISGSVVGNRIPSVTCTPWVQGNLPHPDDTQGLHYAFAGSPITIEFCAQDPDASDMPHIEFGMTPPSISTHTIGGPMAITDIELQWTQSQASDLLARGFEATVGNTNEGAGGALTRVWVKRAPSGVGVQATAAITQVEVSTTSLQEAPLLSAG